MNQNNVKKILDSVANGKLSVENAIKKLSIISFDDIGFAKLDHHRLMRTGIPEVIFAPGKTDDQIVKIVGKMIDAGSDIIISRAEKSIFIKLRTKFKGLSYNETAKMILRMPKKKKQLDKHIVAVITAGTSDIRVAEEAAVTLDAFGARVERIFDVGVAGIHRLFAQSDKIREADVIIVVAGMEGALASVVGGLVTAPVIAVPTSVGYGASFGGLAALLAMLNSCAPGVTVVNIDNGFGAAMAALKMAKIR